jgi:DNA invertase Pin-like site-specific DNA recombinase
MSIENQKMILSDYAAKNGFGNIEFFIDDGFSGVDFERREGLALMIREVEAGRVATVITKDLSRLGRNYLRTGELIEIIFPSHDVRYIAISDGVDTAQGDNEFMPLRNWVNEFYARDASKKIRAVKKAQAQKGQRCNGITPYGYMRCPDNKYQLIPDPETAHVVKRIFDMYAQGARITHIQDWLERNKILTIAELEYRRKGKSRHKRPAEEFIYSWPNKTIYGILARKEYLGHTYTGKSTRMSYKSRKTRKNPEEEQYFFPNTHEPLINEETFALARKRAATKHRRTKTNEVDIFSGILYCADCGHKMHFKQSSTIPERHYAYTCGNYRSSRRGERPCTMHYIRKPVISELVLVDMQRVLACVKVNEKGFVQKAMEFGRSQAQKSVEHKRRELNKATARLSEINTIFRKLYEDMALGRINSGQFDMLQGGFDEERQILQERAAALELETKNTLERKAEAGKFVQTVKKYTQIEELTYENIHDLIDKILIHETDHKTKTRKIEILYNFVGKTDEVVMCG